MKKLILLCLTTIFAVSANAQMSTIKGYFTTEKVSEISLFTILEGELVPYAKTKLADDGSFAFQFKTPYEGFYVVGAERALGEQTQVYLKLGDNAELTMGNKKAEFTKNNTKENIILGEWLKLSQSVRAKSIYFMGSMSTYVDFFPEFEAVVKEAKKFDSQIKSKNQKFNELMRDVVRFETDLFAVNFVRTPRTAHPTEEQMIPYYNNIVKENYFANDNILKILHGERWLRMYAEFNSDYRNLDAQLARLSTDIQKGVYLMNTIRAYKTYEEYLNFSNKYGKYIVTPTQKKRVEDLGAKLYETKRGNAAADFTYPDINGKMVSLSDFKGKVVLVDVWATWCGPCKAEMPALIALEHSLKDNKNIVFMGVSVDEEKDKQAWLNMVKEKGLGGVQLFAAGWGKITKDYKITGIPRFMIFDKKGNVYSVDAPRPSKPELKEILLKLAAE